MENNSDRMGFALIALSVVAFVLLAVNGPLKASADGLFNGFQKWQTTTVHGITETTKQDVTHTAYSWSSDGTDRFTTTKPNLNLLDGSALFTNWMADSVKTNGFNGTFASASIDRSDAAIGSTTRRQLSYYISSNPIQVDVGSYYTFSAYVKVNREMSSLKNNTMAIRFNDTNVYDVDSVDFSTLPLNTWTFVSVTAYVPSSVTKITQLILSLNENGRFEAAAPKLEKGSVATPWMPSSSEVKPSDQPKYIGTYTDKNESASQKPSKYTWKLNPDYHE